MRLLLRLFQQFGVVWLLMFQNIGLLHTAWLLLSYINNFIHINRTPPITLSKSPTCTFLFWGGADGERMPLVLCDHGYLDEHVVAGVIIKVRRSLDYEVGHSGGQQQSGTDVRLSSFRPVTTER